jgi:mono/diheme cytochrome c family protein
MKNKKSTISKITMVIALFLTGFAFIFLFSCNQGPGENSRHAQAQKGKAHFQKYCVSCHGEDAKGMKIDTINAHSADLTTITRRRKASTFPIMEVVRIIDGRNIVKAHGDRPMPAWGDVFAVQEHLDETQIKGKMGELIAYLMTIQGS